MQQTSNGSKDWAAILIEHLTKLNELFKENELAYYTWSSKPEMPIRDRLAFSLHQKLSDDNICFREWDHVDIAILDKKQRPLCLIEVKASSAEATLALARPDYLTKNIARLLEWRNYNGSGAKPLKRIKSPLIELHYDIEKDIAWRNSLASELEMTGIEEVPVFGLFLVPIPNGVRFANRRGYPTIEKYNKGIADFPLDIDDKICRVVESFLTDRQISMSCICSKLIGAPNDNKSPGKIFELSFFVRWWLLELKQGQTPHSNPLPISS